MTTETFAPATTATRIVDYDHAISAVDSAYVRPQLDAIHLIIEHGRAAVIDTGTNDSVPHVLNALAAKRLGPEAVDFVILTHVHLDHAGGAGLLMSKLPSAKLIVHPRGARHMVDPTQLMAGTVAVYGADAARDMYGELPSIPQERIIEATDGSSVSLSGRELTFYDTPGHARHHICIHDERSGHLFTGDMFGLSYRELDRDGKAFVFPATTPIQFDPDAFHKSIDRMMALQPGAVYMTHYGQVRDVPRIAADLLRLVDAHAALGRSVAAGPAEGRMDALRAGVRDIALTERIAQGWGVTEAEALEVLKIDLELNAAGLLAWIDSGKAKA